jgi:hypothetical protein
MNSRLIAVSPDNELDYHRQLAELDSLYRNLHDCDQRTANLSRASYLQKPYSPTKLGRLVRDILDGQEKRAVS